MARRLTIVEARTRPDDAPALAALQRAEWGHLYPDETLDDAIAELRTWRDDPTDPERLLLSWFALVDDESVGVIMVRGAGELEPDDAARLPGPWLAGLVVRPEHRGSGIASALMDHATARAAAMGITRLRLVTEHEVEFHARRGWEIEATVLLAGHPNTVMLTTLAP